MPVDVGSWFVRVPLVPVPVLGAGVAFAVRCGGGHAPYQAGFRLYLRYALLSYERFVVCWLVSVGIDGEGIGVRCGGRSFRIRKGRE